jgi:hypothetical protein
MQESEESCLSYIASGKEVRVSTVGPLPVGQGNKDKIMSHCKSKPKLKLYSLLTSNKQDTNPHCTAARTSNLKCISFQKYVISNWMKKNYH